MIGRKNIIGVAMVFLVLVVLQPLSQLSGQEKLTKEQWLKDLKFIEETIIKKHRHPFRKISPVGFAKGVQRLRGLIPLLKEHEIMVELARIVALISDGHSRLSLPVADVETIQSHHAGAKSASPIRPFLQLPLKFYYFSDGLYITEAREKYKNLLGKKVLAFDKSATRKVLQTMKQVIHKDNTMWDLVWAPYLATMPAVLAALKLTADPSQVTLELQGTNEDSTTRTFRVADQRAKGKWIKLANALPAKPLYLQQPDNPFWLKFLRDKEILYVQVNGIRDKKEETLAQFSRRMAQALDKHTVQKLVLDIRHNTGGNNYLNRSLILAILRSPHINRYGKFFTIIGRSTFSAAMNLASQLEQWTNTIFVGEPTGSSPSHYGDSKKFRLPNSGLTLRLSSIYWRGWTVQEKRLWIEPELSTDTSSAQFLKGLDPTLEMVKKSNLARTLYGQLEHLFGLRKFDQAFLRFYKFKHDPATAHISTETDLNQLGSSLIWQKRYMLAARVLHQNLRDYPRSYTGWILLAKAYLLAKQKERAIKAINKALEIKPKDPEAMKLLKAAKG